MIHNQLRGYVSVNHSITITICLFFLSLTKTANCHFVDLSGGKGRLSYSLNLKQSVEGALTLKSIFLVVLALAALEAG